MSSTPAPKKLSILTSATFNHKVMMEAREHGTWDMINGDNEECCFWLEEKAALASKDETKQIKAKLNKKKAIQKTVNFIWNSLHHQDQDRVYQEMMSNNLIGMWKALQMRET